MRGSEWRESLMSGKEEADSEEEAIVRVVVKKRKRQSDRMFVSS